MDCAVPSTLTVPDYSTFHGGCDHCGKILSEVKDSQPRPCYRCGLAHYCSPTCLVVAFRTAHRRQCRANLDAEIDMQGAQTLSTSQALWDLRKYTARWHDELGDAAIAAMNLHADATAIDRHALVVRVAYIPHQWRRMQRFRLQYAAAEPLPALTGPSMDAAKSRQKEHTVKNRQNGMVGSALIVLACHVPHVGFIYNSTFVGPEPDLLVDPPPVDWLQRLIASVRVNEPISI